MKSEHDAGGLLSVLLIAVLAGAGALWPCGADAALIVVAIGIDQYDCDDVLPVRGAVNDARGIVAALGENWPGGSFQAKVLTSDRSVDDPLYPTRDAIVLAFDWAQTVAGAEDTFIFFFAGHGMRPEGWEDSFILPVDVPSGSDNVVTTRSLSLNTLAKLITGVRCAHHVIIMDCCRNDPFVANAPIGRAARTTGAASEELTRDVRVMGLAGFHERVTKSSAVLFACSSGQKARWLRDGSNGVFTHFLIRGIKGEAARGGVVTLPDLWDYAEEQAQQYVSREYAGATQVPWHKDEGTGSVVLSRGAGVEPLLTMATLRVAGQPAGADVYVDGQHRGTLPCEITVDLGPLHEKPVEVVVQQDGYESKGGRLSLKRGQTHRWRAVLERMSELVSSHLGNSGPKYEAGMTPRRLGWGSDDRAYPSKFVVNPRDGAEMVWVPAGEFMMGSKDESIDEKPVHKVRITKGFWMYRQEVTNAQYRGLCVAMRHRFPSESSLEDDHPVVAVSWEDAAAYCEHYGLRLPTEAEWEYAARGPEGRKYPWGDEWDKGKCCNEDNRGLGGRTFPVGSFPQGASWCGALDMAGNVWEWCSDWYGDEYYRSSPSTDPSGPGGGEYRVVRGGGWRSYASECRSALRRGSAPSRRGSDGGFRPVVSPFR